MSRTDAWWRTRRLDDDPARRKGGPLACALLLLDGEPAAYALYRVTQDWSGGMTQGTVRILETATPTPESARELWRWLFDFDWTSQFVAPMLPVDHPLFLLLAEPRSMALRVEDGIMARLVDVEAALRARAYESGEEVVFDVVDETAPWNSGRFRVSADGVARTDAEPDLRLGIAALSSAYLGGFRFGELARALRLEEIRRDGVARADALFAVAAEPWCAEVF